MSAINYFSIGFNSFEGALPESGLQERCPTGRLQGSIRRSKLSSLTTMPLKARCHPLLDQKLSSTRFASQRQEFNLQYTFTEYDFESVNLDRCNTLITWCMGGRPQPQLAGRANSTALAWRQRSGPKNCGSQSLRLECPIFHAHVQGQRAYASPTKAGALLHE
eukprot:6467120-Amphidinium_carterae.1